MREPISLKEILAVLVKRGWGILLTALVLAAALGGYQLSNQVKLSQRPENSAEQIEEAYKAAVEEYDEQLADLKADLEDAELLLERQKAYNDSSILMKMDPYNCIQHTTVYKIGSVDAGGMAGTEDQSEDRYERMLADLQEIYNTYWTVADLSNELQNSGMDGLEEKYIREAVIFTPSRSGTITIVARGENPEVVEKLAKAADQCLMRIKTSVETKIYKHELTKLNSVTKTEMSDAVLNHQQYNFETLEKYEEEVEDLKAELEDLVAPQRRPGYSKREMLIASVKWAILGAVAGGVLACVWVLVCYLFRSRVESSRQMEQVLGIPFLGSAAKPGNIWKRLAGRMLNERTWKDPEQAKEYISEAIRAVANEPEQVLILTTLAGEKLDLSGIEQTVGKAVCVKDAERNAQTVKMLQGIKCVVLAERVGVSEVPKMLSILELAKRMDATVVGFVTV